MRTLTRTLYPTARVSATGRAIRRGNTVNRVKNVAVGRGINRAGGWRRLWGPWR